jgi:hypothetical protein
MFYPIQQSRLSGRKYIPAIFIRGFRPTVSPADGLPISNTRIVGAPGLESHAGSLSSIFIWCSS